MGIEASIGPTRATFYRQKPFNYLEAAIRRRLGDMDFTRVFDALLGRSAPQREGSALRKWSVGDHVRIVSGIGAGATGTIIEAFPTSMMFTVEVGVLGRVEHYLLSPRDIAPAEGSFL